MECDHEYDARLVVSSDVIASKWYAPDEPRPRRPSLARIIRHRPLQSGRWRSRGYSLTESGSGSRLLRDDGSSEDSGMGQLKAPLAELDAVTVAHIAAGLPLRSISSQAGMMFDVGPPRSLHVTRPRTLAPPAPAVIATVRVREPRSASARRRRAASRAGPAEDSEPEPARRGPRCSVCGDQPQPLTCVCASCLRARLGECFAEFPSALEAPPSPWRETTERWPS